jgi:hypothetical protein
VREGNDPGNGRDIDVSDPRDEEIRRLRARVAKLEADNEESLRIAEESTTLLQQVAGQRDDYARQVAVMGRWLDRNITLEDAMAHALGRILEDALAAPNAWEREVVVGSPDGTKRTARFSVAWADGESLHALLARAREERDAAQAEARGWRSECDGMMEGIMRKEVEVADALHLAAEARVRADDAMREGLAACEALRAEIRLGDAVLGSARRYNAALNGQIREMVRSVERRNAAVARQRRDAERFRTERNTMRDRLLNLLARIHRDGGHYTTEHGVEKACEDADGIVAELLGGHEAYGAAAQTAALTAEKGA